MRTSADVIGFWFERHDQEDWFGGKPEFDAALALEFGETLPRVAKGEAYRWRETPDGRLAEIIVLDQFSRQLHRGSPLAFAQDPMALALAQEAVAQGVDEQVDAVRRPFFYMPYIHSESLMIHEEAMRLFTGLGDDNQLRYAVNHHAIIARFGRFPMRNKVLGRKSTEDEEAYIAEAGSRPF